MEKGDGDEAMTAATEDAGDMAIQIIDMKIKIEGEVEVKVEGSITRIGDMVKRIFQGEDAGHGSIMIQIIVTETIGIDRARANIIVMGDGTVTGDKTTVTEAEVDDGTNMSNTPHRNTPRITRRLIITGPHQWGVNTNTKCRMSNTHPTHNKRNNIPNGHLHNHGKLQIYVSYVKTKATMIINASLQAILWPGHKRRLIKAAHTIIKNLLKGNGQMGRMIMMTPMASLFSSRGSRCR